MYKTLLIFFVAVIISFSVSGQEKNGEKYKDISENFFLSKTAVFGYGMVAGIALAVGIVFLSIEKVSHKPSGNKKRTATEREKEYKLQELEEKYNLALTECINLKSKIATLESDLAKAREQQPTGMQETESMVMRDPNRTEAQHVPTELGSTSIYYLQPATDSRFREQGRVSHATDALYVLTYQNNNPSEATLKFIDTPENTSLAVQNESTWILVACERSNIPTEHTTSIRTDTPGKAILRNKEWEILQKAKITYL
jgi:hypothetical protein